MNALDIELRKKLPTVGHVVKAMCEGLREISKRENFEIQMNTFGRYDSDLKICFGCAATCTLMKTLKWSYKKVHSHNQQPLTEMERAIDDLRRGHWESIEQLYYPKGEHNEFFHNLNLPKLNTHDWHIGITAYEYVAEEMLRLGI